MLFFFFNLKFSWGRLEKETQIPEGGRTSGLGVRNSSPEQKGKREARDAMPGEQRGTAAKLSGLGWV